MSPSTKLDVRDPLSASVREFFDSHGMECIAYDDDALSIPGSDLEVGSMVGFYGHHVKGGLAFIAPLRLVAALLPVPAHQEQADLQLCDWSAEIANQILGRLKNKLTDHAIDFSVGSPVVFRGTCIELSLAPGTSGTSLRFRSHASSFRVHLDCTITGELPVAPAGPSHLRVAHEGDLLLF